MKCWFFLVESFALRLAVLGSTVALSDVCHTEVLNSWGWKGPLCSPIPLLKQVHLEQIAQISSLLDQEMSGSRNKSVRKPLLPKQFPILFPQTE